MWRGPNQGFSPPQSSYYHPGGRGGGLEVVNLSHNRPKCLSSFFTICASYLEGLRCCNIFRYVKYHLASSW